MESESGLRQKLAELEIVKAALQKNKEELEEFARVAAHDLKSPLSNIQAIAMILKKQYADELQDEGLHLLDLLQNANTQVITRLNDIRRYSKIFELPTEKEEIELSQLIKNVLQTLAPPPEIQFIYPRGPVSIVTSPAILKEILCQLFSNAIRHNTKEIGTVELRFSEEETCYTFKVVDNGNGILPEFQEKIFGLFQTLGRQDRFNTTGTGLGLCIVKKLVEQAGGRVTLFSEAGEGSTFEFTLPKEVDR